MSHKSFAGLLIAIALSVSAPSPVSARVESVPNPLETAGKFVGDNAGVLGPAYADLIDGVCERLKSATGAELAVITVRDLAGMEPEDFAGRLFKRFGIGEKGRENGLLLLFALDDRAVRFEVGYGLEGVIPDALAGRLLDEQAIPHLAAGAYGRGLYAVAKAAAETIAAASNVSLGISEPGAWPEQPQPAARAQQVPLSAATAAKRRSPRIPPLLSAIMAAVLLGSTGLWILSARRRFGRARSMAGKAKAAGAGIGYVIMLWIAASVILIILLSGKSPALSILTFALAPAAASFLWSATRRGLKKRAGGYRLPCPSCNSPMDLVPDDQDDASLSVEEAAEEMAGGMDYELWICPRCAARETFAVKLPKASPCPVCGRRTLVRSRVVLAAATTSQGGRERITDACKNPKCGHSKTWERSTARIAAAAAGSGAGRSSSHGSSGSSRSSFGGGRSGGGGATRRF